MLPLQSCSQSGAGRSGFSRRYVTLVKGKYERRLEVSPTGNCTGALLTTQQNTVKGMIDDD